MARPTVTVLAITAALLLGSVVPVGVAAAAPRAHAPAPDGQRLSADPTDRWIVTWKAGANVAAGRERAKGRGIAAEHEFRRVLRGYSARLDPAQLAAVRADPAVESVVPDAVISVQGQE